jgi:Mn-dependent DtxR family transcriptional regulator
VAKRHEILHDFLLLLGVPAEVAEHDACAMEHLLSKETYTAIEKFRAEKKTADGSGINESRRLRR